MSWSTALFVLGYIFAFMAGGIGLSALWKYRRGTEVPFGDDMKLLRNAGESQFELVRAFDEAFSEKVMLWGGAPGIPVVLLILAMSWLPKSMHTRGGS